MTDSVVSSTCPYMSSFLGLRYTAVQISNGQLEAAVKVLYLLLNSFIFNNVNLAIELANLKI